MNASKEKLTGQIGQLEQTKVLFEESMSKLQTENEDLRKALEQARNELKAAKTRIDQQDKTINGGPNANFFSRFLRDMTLRVQKSA